GWGRRPQTPLGVEGVDAPHSDPGRPRPSGTGLPRPTRRRSALGANGQVRPTPGWLGSPTPTSSNDPGVTPAWCWGDPPSRPQPPRTPATGMGAPTPTDPFPAPRRGAQR